MENIQNIIKMPTNTSDTFRTMMDFKIGWLSSLRFDMALRKVDRAAGIQTKGSVLQRSVHSLVYTDNIDIIDKTRIGFF